ncbi:AsmA family protein [Mangrovibacterium lignilyticum]|uniref:AsmA family protein n=1 Tax=Mangrovibacterium lignilyticum TaxID=2668052 RepID=UPI0013D58CD4|nr:AsmA family protein [Mangrovibacterium lignilyticum]
MKKAGKFVLYLMLSVLSLLVILAVVASLMQDKIVKLALEQVSETTNIPIETGEIDFSLIRNFPMATLDCRDLLISSPDSLRQSNSAKDTLLYVGRLYVSVQAKPLLKGIFEVRKVEIADADVFYEVDSLGKTNYDFLMDTKQSQPIDTASNSIYLDVKTFELNHVTCHYDDQKLNAQAKLVLEEVDLSGLIDNSQYYGNVEGEAYVTDCNFPEIQLGKMGKATLKFNLDYKDQLLSIQQTDIAIDDKANLAVKGYLIFSDKLMADLKLQAGQLDVAGLAEYMPANWFENYGVHKLDGTVNVNATVSGYLNDSTALPHIDATVDLSNGSIKYLDYPEISRIVLQAKATNGAESNNRTSKLEVDSLSFFVANSLGSLKGTVENLDQLTYALNSSVDVDLNDVNPFIPDSILKRINGRIKADISTKGIFPDSMTDHFINSVAANTTLHLNATEVNVELDSLLSVIKLNGELQYNPNQLTVEGFTAEVPAYKLSLRKLDLNTAFSGELIRPESLDFTINKLELETDSCTASFDGSLKNPMAPDYNLNGKLKLNLAEVYSMLPDSLVSGLSGNVSVNLHSAAKINLDSISDQIQDVLFTQGDFAVNFRNVSLDMPDSLMCVQKLSGDVKYQADTVWIDQLEGGYQGLNFGARATTIANVYSAAIQNKPKELLVHGNFSVDSLDYAWIESFLPKDSVDSSNVQDSEETSPMNFTYKVNGRFEANELKYGPNVFENVATKFLVKDSYYVLDSLSMEAYQGKALSSIKVEMKPEGEMDLFFKTNVGQMNVSEMAKGLEDYITMDDFTADNVKGTISTRMDGKIVLDKNFEPVYNSLMLKGDLDIANGALINVKPVMEVEKIPAVGLKNMDKLYFSTLKSSIFLFNNKLYIPQTEIRSSSFDAMFLGMYSFGEDYAYHIRMFLGEVLSSKSKANLRKQSQDDGFEEDQSDDITKGRTSIYLVSKKENGKEKAWFDNRKDRTNMVAKVKMQEGALKFKFHPLFVTYETE